ncbi:hypothetical protein CaCOL14_003460 [Colletotrichum acutatum]|uniref:Uncharacterized protein n=1 Tax=Glomerella acutata TaxID=27357 RepID=A0AAD8UCN8_GLOAC|nr:uncharacterized protein BDZ83DRAFT_756175 [Colletotrichum acutatum]KAK1716009.1 hypothetical protein BDZ83DRAFT_756175 [Colletotrichum acutatum]
MASNNSSSPADDKANEMSGISMVTATAYLRKLLRDTPPEELRKMLDDMAKERQAFPEERLRKKEARDLLVAARKRAEARCDERRAQRDRDFETGKWGPIDISPPTMELIEDQAEWTEEEIPELDLFGGFQLSRQLDHLGHEDSEAGYEFAPFEEDEHSEYLPQSAAPYESDWILPWVGIREED